MAYSTVPKMRRDGKITLKDGTGVPVTLEVAYEEGNFTFTPTKAAQVIIRDRHAITNVRRGDEEPAASGSFSIYLREFTDSAQAGSVLDFVNKTGSYSSNTSTGASGTPQIEEYCIDIEYTIEGTDLGDDADHVATITKCICDVVYTEGDPSTLAINFVSFGALSYTGPS
jgi:hypothetical protein